jgi:hypothetical protein
MFFWCSYYFKSLLGVGSSRPASSCIFFFFQILLGHAGGEAPWGTEEARTLDCVRAALATDVAAENAELSDKVHGYNLYPVVRIGVSYRF